LQRGWLRARTVPGPGTAAAADGGRPGAASQPGGHLPRSAGGLSTVSI